MPEKTITDLTTELAEISARFIDLPEKYRHVSEDMFKAADEWVEIQVQNMIDAGVIANIDAGSIERGKMIYLNMLVCQRLLLEHGYLHQTENGFKTNPISSELRQWLTLWERWQGQHAAYPMARHNKNMNLEDTGGVASHGNKKVKKVMDLISGSKDA